MKRDATPPSRASSRCALAAFKDSAPQSATRRFTSFASSIAAPVVSHPARAGLIEKSTRPRGGYPQSSSTRPAGLLPAGVTQGEEI